MSKVLDDKQQALAAGWYNLSRLIARRYLKKAGPRINQCFIWQVAQEWADDQVVNALMDSAAAYDPGRGSFGALLERASTRRLYDRKLFPRFRPLSDMDVAGLLDDEPDPTLAIEQDEFWSAVRERLKPKAWLVILLMYRYGMTPMQAGRIMGLKDARICQIRQEALWVLRDSLRQEAF